MLMSPTLSQGYAMKELSRDLRCVAPYESHLVMPAGIILLLLLVGCCSVSEPSYRERFPATCAHSSVNSDLSGYTVHEYPCNWYQTDLAGNKK